MMSAVNFFFLCFVLLLSSLCLAEKSCPTHELIYFDFTGRGEAIRVMLHASGLEWKDTRISFSDWPEIKPTTPLGVVPLLKIDGNTYLQSLALLRYAGKQAGFYPEDPLEALKVDQAMDSVNEMTSQAPRSEDEEEFKKLRKDFQEGTMTRVLTYLESTIEGTGFASTPSIADLYLSYVINDIKSGMWSHVDTNVVDQFPKISATVEAIQKNEKVLAYYASLEE